MGDTNEVKPVLGVRIDAELLRRVDALCERTGLGRAQLVERCLAVGVQDQEEWVRLLESPVFGELVDRAARPAVVKVLCKLFKLEPDPIQEELRKNLARKRKGAAKTRPAGGGV